MIARKDIQTLDAAHRILLRANDFIYILPHPALQEQISNYTITFPNKNIISDNYTVVPHGSATLVFSLDRNGWYGNLFGPITKPCMVGGIANQCEMLLIIEFQPAGLSAFTGANQKELTDQIFSFEMINPVLNGLILETLESAGRSDELINRLDRLLLQHLQTAYPSALKIATRMMIESTGSISCKELSASVYYSGRHLNRIFEQYLGMNTKTFSRMVRINKAIRLMQNPRCSITSASYGTGFYDLPHFIRDFKSVCGMTPQEYRNNMSDFYSEIAKF
ncbi:MAG: helix-turn-helix transcriptional regulator [Lachnospiraceae bacterium]|nr:helix-turn-helix transcriptional regulator [Lachnospiraceae bacterium]